MPFKSYKTAADPHISEEMRAECIKLIESVAPKDVDIFEEMLDQKLWGHIPPYLKGALNLVEQTPEKYPAVTIAQQVCAKRLCEQLQFTGRWE